MKNQLITRLFLFIFSLIMFTNCKKSDDANPANIADRIAGNYTMTQITANGQTIAMPYNQGGQQLSGTITITKVSLTTVSFSYTLTSVTNGVKAQDSDTSDFTIKLVGNSIELYEANNLTVKLGTFSGNTLVLDSGGTKITASKN